jgi:hypothetical protein
VCVDIEAIDFDHLEQQNFSLLLHKMCSHFALYDRDIEKRRQLDQLRGKSILFSASLFLAVPCVDLRLSAAYLAAHPAKDFQSLAAVEDINSRRTVAEKLADFHTSWGGVAVLHPPFHVVETRAEAARLAGQFRRGATPIAFSLPWVCKPEVADGVPESHSLGMVTAPEGLTEPPEIPYILEPFVNHGGEIVKVYVLGDTMLQLRRPSLPDVVRGGEPARVGPFYEPFGRISNPNALPSDAKVRVLPEDEQQRVPELSEALLALTVAELKHRLGVDLFGVDLIRDSETGNYLIIDVNFCPGYYGVSNVFEKLLDLFRERLKL